MQRYKSQVIYAKNLTNMFWRERQRWLRCCRRPLSPGICGEFADGAILEEASFPWHFWHLWHLAFLAFGSFGTGEGLLWYGICTRCAKQAPVVRDAYSKAFGVKNRLLRYGRNIRYRKPPSLVRDAFSCFTIKTRHKTPQKTTNETPQKPQMKCHKS